MENLKIKVAEELLRIKAVFLRPSEPFTWASGIKSPIYCDNRLVLSDIEARDVVENGLVKIIETYYSDVEVIMGTSTAGIAHAALVANILKLPMGYVRANKKDHGRTNQIEGANPTGKKVVVIEDLISTGGSSIEVVEILREAGANVLGIASIFTYGLKKGLVRLEESNIEDLISTGGSSIEVVEILREAGANVLGIASIFTYGLKKGLVRLEESNTINHSLSNFDVLAEVALKNNYINEKEYKQILKFREEPSDPSWQDL